MQSFPPTLIWRHRKENLKKCSLRGLEARPDFCFHTYPNAVLPPLNEYILLAVDAPPLAVEDAASGILILDATWRYAGKMLEHLASHAIDSMKWRSIPSGYRTAYPRRQDDCPDPTRGLASIEAIYIAYHLLGRNTDGLLNHYYWGNHFLQINAQRFGER